MRLTQIQLANALGWSYGSIQGYERGAKIPGDRIEQLKTFATQHGHADIALTLSSEQWHVQTVIHPIQPRQQATEENQSWHEMLDEILDSGMPELINAVQSNLLVFRDHVRLRGAPPAAKTQIPPGKSRRK